MDSKLAKIKRNKSRNVTLEGIRIRPGGRFDRTKAVSPDIFYEHGIYRLFYIGTSCMPEERKSYAILLATSTDGLHFIKKERPIIGTSEEWTKVYSPHIVKIGKKYCMYFAAHINGTYVIRRAVSEDCLNFKVEDGTIIGVGKNHSKAAYTPKLLCADNVYNCYYAGSNSGRKIFSRKYPNHDFSDSFRIFLAISRNGVAFEPSARLKSIERKGLINYYGHNVVRAKGKVYLFFTAFDGRVNRIYISESDNGKDFAKQVCILEPDEGRGEIGTYSCTLLPIGDDRFRIYYGVRYLDNRWTINSATFDINSIMG
jgi:predicted GH43/DUF377 family glycosyl hydrolase